MAIEANPTGMAPTIQPVQRPQSTGTTEGVNRRGDGGASSPFSPQTNVTVKNSIADMAGVLAKISTNQEEAVEAMPQQLQKVIQQVLQSSFSLQDTMAQGLGSTVESQRFSMEQLTTLSRMLSQLGTLGEKGISLENISDSMQALLTNLKEMVTDTQEGSALEPALLNKAAFQLLDTKSAADLPAALQQLIQQLSGTAVQTAAQNPAASDGQGFLKQLIQYFMPAAPAAETAEQGESFAQPQTQQSTAKTMDSAGTAQTALPGQAAAAEDANENVTGTALKQSLPAAEGENFSARPQQAMTEEANFVRGQENAPALANTVAGEKGQVPLQTAAQNQSDGAAGNLFGNSAQEEPAQTAAGSRMGLQQEPLPQNLQQAEGKTGNPGMAQTGSQQQTLPLQNTPQLMETMKNLASLLLKDANLTEKDVTLLQNFVNRSQSTLSEDEAKQLQQLLRLCQSNMPAAVQQAANCQNMTDLPRLWAFMQLCDMTAVKDMKPRQLKAASRDVADFVSAMKQSMGGDHASSVDQQGTVNRSLNFMVPIYLGENGQQSYPAYIHVYDEEKQSEGQAEPQKETWLRLCVLTENIGAVELTCRVYEKQKLNVRVYFSDASAVESFKEYVPEFKASFSDSSLELTDLKIGVAGTKL